MTLAIIFPAARRAVHQAIAFHALLQTKQAHIGMLRYHDALRNLFRLNINLRVNKEPPRRKEPNCYLPTSLPK
jgi:hypothetical protein